MADPDITVATYQENSLRLHVIVGETFQGHRVNHGHDCACEPEVLVPNDQPKARVYFHEVGK